jgi:hypothetical protein
MKKLLIATAIALLSASIWADTSANDDPCKLVKEACEKAGFVKNSAFNGNDIEKDCMEPLIIRNQFVMHITASAEQITACQAKTEAHNSQNQYKS